MDTILDISTFYHDSAAALLHDGEFVAAAQEERFSRKEHDAQFPLNAINYCRAEAGVPLTELDYVVFYDKPVRSPTHSVVRDSSFQHQRAHRLAST